METEQIRQLIDVFAEKTMCGIQHNGCPCNSCVHNLPETINYQHIVWLMLLGIRGDYDMDDITEDIKEELNKDKFFKGKPSTTKN